jgi:hypothetical protein
MVLSTPGAPPGARKRGQARACPKKEGSMTPARTLARRHLCRSLPGVLLLTLVLIGLAAAAPALARSGRVGPASSTAWAPGALATRLAHGADAWYWIWDAQPTGTIVGKRADTGPSTTLTGTDATGATVWTISAGDAWAASGALPAAFVATYADPDPNVLRDGELTAYKADGKLRFHKAFKNEFVQPLADTTKRLVWIETTAKAVTSVHVRQGSTSHVLTLPYVPPKAHFNNPVAASANGRRLIVGTYMPSTSRRSVVTYWLQVSPSGEPRIVSRGITDWVSASLTPSGDKAAVLTSDGLGDGPNWYVTFGKFHGGMLPGNDAGMIHASAQRIFEQGGYSYGSDTTAWGATTVEVFDRSLVDIYKRTWAFDDDTSSIWFRDDGPIDRLAGVDNTGALTVINVDSWAIASVPGTYADAVPIDDGRLATMTTDGTLAFIADPVAGP